MASEITNIAGIGSTTAAVLSQHQFSTVDSIANTTIEELSTVPGFSAARADKTINAAKQLLGVTVASSANDADAFVGESGSRAEGKKAGAKGKKKNKAEVKNKKGKKNKKATKNKKKDKKKNKKGKK